jgi:hypothetical protein
MRLAGKTGFSVPPLFHCCLPSGRHCAIKNKGRMLAAAIRMWRLQMTYKVGNYSAALGDRWMQNIRGYNPTLIR